MRLLGRLKGFLRLPARDRRIFAEAYLWLGLARLATLLLPVRWILGRLGAKTGESPETLDEDRRPLVRRVSIEVRRAARHTPWTSNCLPQAIAAKMLLRRRGLASTLYLGVARKGPLGLEAHAWVRCGDTIVTGKHEMADFQVVATFAELSLTRGRTTNSA